MSLPHTGPISSGRSTPSSTWQRTGYRQKKPFTDVLPLRFAKGSVSSGLGNPDHSATSSSFVYYTDTWNTMIPQVARAQAKCLDKFSSSVQERAMIGVDLAEYHQSIDLLHSAAVRTLRLMHAVRKRDFGLLLRSLDPRGVKTLRGRKVTWSKSFANNFLEVHFGWVPFFQDIFDAAHAISQPLKATNAFGSASDAYYLNSITGSPGFITVTQTSAKVQVKMGADVSCTNPALHLASSLGLINPFSVAWELVPFSFVVDWFSNVGQFVGQLDEFAGLTLSRAFSTIFIHAAGFSSQSNPFWVPANQSYTWENACVTRSQGIPSVPLVLKPLKLPSAVRAVTAVSLVIQQLGRK